MVHQNIQDTREEEKIKMRNDIEHTHTTQPLVQENLILENIRMGQSHWIKIHALDSFEGFTGAAKHWSEEGSYWFHKAKKQINFSYPIHKQRWRNSVDPIEVAFLHLGKSC